MFAPKITKDVIMESINLAECKTNGMDIETFIIPLVSAALKKALTSETRLELLLDSKLVKALNNLKMNGVRKVTLFDRFIAWVFNRVHVDSFQ
jgi:hypothetical protein